MGRLGTCWPCSCGRRWQALQRGMWRHPYTPGVNWARLPHESASLTAQLSSCTLRGWAPSGPETGGK